MAGYSDETRRPHHVDIQAVTVHLALHKLSTTGSSEIQLEQTREFWKLKSHQNFDCDADTDSETSDW